MNDRKRTRQQIENRKMGVILGKTNSSGENTDNFTKGKEPIKYLKKRVPFTLRVVQIDDMNGQVQGLLDIL